MTTLEFKHVSFRYPGQLKNSIDDICFTIEQGELAVLCGQSGCGKSTLLKHTKKNQIPTGKGTGIMLFEGDDIEQLDDRESAKCIGFVGQNPDGQIVTDTVWHELAFGLECMGCTRDEMHRRIAEMSEYFGISGWFDKKVSELSGGQKQILNLAAVMVMHPKMLVLDEPTSQLDPIASEKFIYNIEKLNRDFGITILISEQRVQEVLPVADKVILMHQGRIAGIVTPGECAKLMHDIDSPVYEALPATMRLFNDMHCTGKVPVTVKSGKVWLSHIGIDRKVGERESKNINMKSNEGNVKAENALSARGVSFAYGSNKVLKDFDLDIPLQCMYAILGGNGSGKTTAMKILAGVYKPLRGKVKHQGKVVYLPQNPQSVFTEVTAYDELMEVYVSHDGMFKSLSNDEKIQRVKGMLNQMELSEYAGNHPFDLSFGQQQRLALAKVLVLEPDVLMLDEPTKGLDAAFKKKLSHMLRGLVDGGMTVILVSHDIDFCADNADYCSLLFDGQITEREKCEKFFGNNYFYTTAVCRLFNNIVTSENIVTYSQALQYMESESGLDDI